jgi:hypothetical protein
VKVSAASWRTSVQLHRVSALLWARVVEGKLHVLDRAVKANFDPNQPRVPAGNPDGGQWTDGGGGGTDDVRVAQVRRPPRGTGASGGTVVQRFVRGLRQSEAREAIQRVQEIDPNWKPRSSLTRPNSVEGEIARAEAERHEAEARLRDLARQDPRDLMDAFRRQQGLDLLGDPIWSREQNSVSTCQVNGVPYIGVNSQALTYSSRDNAKAEQLRDTLTRDFPRRMNTDNIGRYPNNAVFHAETTCLLRAARANGGTLAGKTIEVTVDREMCPSCEKILPVIGLELGNPVVTFVDPVGRVRKMHNGEWIE